MCGLEIVTTAILECSKSDKVVPLNQRYLLKVPVSVLHIADSPLVFKNRYGQRSFFHIKESLKLNVIPYPIRTMSSVPQFKKVFLRNSYTYTN